MALFKQLNISSFQVMYSKAEDKILDYFKTHFK